MIHGWHQPQVHINVSRQKKKLYNTATLTCDQCQCVLYTSSSILSLRVCVLVSGPISARLPLILTNLAVVYNIAEDHAGDDDVEVGRDAGLPGQQVLVLPAPPP